MIAENLEWIVAGLLVFAFGTALALYFLAVRVDGLRQDVNKMQGRK